ncbi:MAG: hypothetical protein RSE22_00245 [Mucinivorans sp.]
MNKSIIIFTLFLLVGCAGEMTSQKAHEMIAAQSEFNTPFYAPLHLSPQVLTGENHTDPNAFVNAKYGKLISAGVIEAKLGASNSWRTLLKLQMTAKGDTLVNKERTLDDMYYVAVCRMTVDSILSLTPLGGDTVLCHYRIGQADLTPFGHYLGFTAEQTHLHDRKFVRSTFSWQLVPIQ